MHTEVAVLIMLLVALAFIAKRSPTRIAQVTFMMFVKLDLAFATARILERHAIYTA